MRKEPDPEIMMLPPLPPVQSDTALAIFVHSSLKSPVRNERFGDADRLACLGQKALHMVIAETLFEKRPMLDATALIVSSPCSAYRSHINTPPPQIEIDNTLTEESYDQWVSHYKLRDKVACPADHREELREARVRFQNPEVGGQFMLTRGYRRHNYYLMPTSVLST
jgi:hypothetical protein